MFLQPALLLQTEPGWDKSIPHSLEIITRWGGALEIITGRKNNYFSKPLKSAKDFSKQKFFLNTAPLVTISRGRGCFAGGAPKALGCPKNITSCRTLLNSILNQRTRSCGRANISTSPPLCYSTYSTCQDPQYGVILAMRVTLGSYTPTSTAVPCALSAQPASHPSPIYEEHSEFLLPLGQAGIAPRPLGLYVPGGRGTLCRGCAQTARTCQNFTSCRSLQNCILYSGVDQVGG